MGFQLAQVTSELIYLLLHLLHGCELIWILLEFFLCPPEPFMVSNPSGFAAWIHNGLRYHESSFLFSRLSLLL